MSIHVASFYRFVAIEDPVQLRQFLLDIQTHIPVSGLVYTAKEGINGTVAGSKEQITSWFSALEEDTRLSALSFRLS